MTPERWQRVEALYHAARSRDDSERRAFLAQACEGDASLQGEVESLLAATEGTSSDFTGFTGAPLGGHPASADLVGRQFGDYRIQSRLGAGGMGEVYLAHDVRLRRDVAVKTLPRLLTSDPERLARFEREARTLAALNHSHIGAIYGVVEIDGAPALVLELVDGETLADRIASGPIPPEASLGIASQLVDALSAAHAKGIVHRDLKPANIKVTPAFVVKVLDFGLAKAVSTAPIDELTGSPAVSGTATRSGVIVGTAAYMSPEQARGRRVDERTDVWAFGCVLYEMLTGRKAFAGDTIADVLAGILEREPDWSALPVGTPISVRQLLPRCLEKDADRRLPNSAAIATALRRAPRPAATLWRNVTPRVARRLAVVATTVGLLLLGWTFYSATPGAKSLAILPFVNDSGNAELEYLSDGITESLINALSQVPPLAVASRTEVFRLKSQEPDVKKAARTLNVDAVVVGRMGQRGDELTFSVELDDAATGRALWGERYNRKLQDLLGVQETISTEITGALRLKLTGEERQRMTHRYTENTDAYRLYLQGRYQWNKKNPDGFERGIELFEQATQTDPGYAPAYAAVAALYNNLANFNFAIKPPREAWGKAQKNAQMAVDLDDTLASAHASLALVAYQWQWDWAKADGEFKRALALGSTSSSTLEPNPASTWHWYAHYLLTMGRVEEALQAGQRALQLDPLDLANNAHQGWHYLFTHDYDRAVAPLQKAIVLDPTWPVSRWYLGLVYEQQGAYDKAIAEFKECVKVTRDRPSMVALLGHAYAAAGQRREAEDVLQKLQAAEKEGRYVAPYPIAAIHAALGDREAAFVWLEKAFDQRDSWLNYLGLDPRLDGLHGDAQFADLMGRLNLPMVKPR